MVGPGPLRNSPPCGGCNRKQIAKSFEAEVTGMDSTRKFDMLRSMGAGHVIDYTQICFLLHKVYC